MMLFLISCAAGGLAILLGECLRVRGYAGNEVSRKITHIAHALTVAVWPFLISYRQIMLAELAVLFLVLAARRLHLFKAMREVRRSSWGDVLFALAVIMMAFVAPRPLVFVAALVILGLGDGLAALIGRKFASKRYTIYGQHKSWAGTAAFWAVSAVTVLVSVRLANVSLADPTTIFALFTIPPILCFIENTSANGSDNFTVPLTAMLLLGLVVS